MNWEDILQKEFNKEYFKKMSLFLSQEESRGVAIFPIKEKRFKAFQMTPYDEVKVVIIGQDPYHKPGLADGLSFSADTNLLPKSLKNIFKELSSDLKIKEPQKGSLSNWAKEGVLLLNTILTVEQRKPLSHKNIGWEIFTNEVIKCLNNKEQPVVFILWGNEALKYHKMINSKKHLIITSSHPSFFSANKGFFGSKPFSKTNAFLKLHNIKEVNWNL